MASSSKLFTPLKLGAIELKHRVVMAPLTRYRSTEKEHVPLGFVKEYYGQRGSTPGTLLITEATFIASQAGGYDNVPGIWSDAQITAWKEVTDEVHKHGSFIFLQLWALGRAATPAILEEDGHPYVSSSATPFKDGEVPRALTIPEIKEYVELYAQAADNAVHKAGFDGVEIHGANGYLIDQFLQDVVNKRTDEYGGSIENRSRFAVEVTEAVVNRVGAERTGIRFSPFGRFQEMRMEDPIPQFTHVISALADRFPKLAYIHLVDPRVAGNVDYKEDLNTDSLDFARDAWRKTGSAFLSAGGHTAEGALEYHDVEGRENDAVVFGRWFISNPDLPKRIQKKIPLQAYDYKTFYLRESKIGYVDYPFAEDQALN